MTFRVPMPGLALRLLLAAACVLPFTGVAAAAAVLTPASAPAAPVGPVNEEDEREEEEVVRSERAGHDRPAGPRAARGAAHRLPILRFIPRLTSGPSRPTAADPFRNGLGTPFRC